MLEFIDKTSESSGTKLNRINMMALQGYQTETVEFGENSITKTNSNGDVETTVFEGNKITKNIVGKSSMKVEIVFNENGYERRIV